MEAGHGHGGGDFNCRRRLWVGIDGFAETGKEQGGNGVGLVVERVEMADKLVGQGFGLEAAGQRRGCQRATAVGEAGARRTRAWAVGLTGGEDALARQSGSWGQRQQIVVDLGNGRHGLLVAALGQGRRRRLARVGASTAGAGLELAGGGVGHEFPGWGRVHFRGGGVGFAGGGVGGGVLG